MVDDGFSIGDAIDSAFLRIELEETSFYDKISGLGAGPVITGEDAVIEDTKDTDTKEKTKRRRGRPAGSHSVAEFWCRSSIGYL